MTNPPATQATGNVNGNVNGGRATSTTRLGVLTDLHLAAW